MRKFRATIQITADFETDGDPREFIIRQMDDSIPKKYEFSVSNLSRVKTATTVLGEFGLDEVLPFVQNSAERRNYVINDHTYQVRMDSHRYHLFVKNRQCVACGLEGVKFLLEMPTDAIYPHFNLYAVENDQLVLMTKDHIRSRAHGGADKHDNYQTMCAICNSLKGSSRLSVEAVGKLRQIYNELRRGGSRRQLASRLRKARQSMLQPAESGERESYLQKMRAIHVAATKAAQTHLVTGTNLVLCRNEIKNTSFFLLPIIDVERKRTLGQVVNIIASVPSGTILETSGDYKFRWIRVKCSGQEAWVYHGWVGHLSTPAILEIK